MPAPKRPRAKLASGKSMFKQHVDVDESPSRASCTRRTRPHVLQRSPPGPDLGGPLLLSAAACAVLLAFKTKQDPRGGGAPPLGPPSRTCTCVCVMPPRDPVRVSAQKQSPPVALPPAPPPRPPLPSCILAAPQAPPWVAAPFHHGQPPRRWSAPSLKRSGPHAPSPPPPHPRATRSSKSGTAGAAGGKTPSGWRASARTPSSTSAARP